MKIRTALETLREKNKGFTLIELMIVIAIIGILAAIAVPNFNRARAQAKMKACVSNMKTIEGAVELYNMENPTNTSISVQELATKGYVKTAPKCPTVNSDQYTVNVGTSGGGTGGAGAKTEIKCPGPHGNLSDPKLGD